MRPITHQTVYVGQLQSLSLVDNLIFITDSEGVLTVIKGIFQSGPQPEQLTIKKEGDTPDIGLGTEPKIQPDIISEKASVETGQVQFHEVP